MHLSASAPSLLRHRVAARLARMVFVGAALISPYAFAQAPPIALSPTTLPDGMVGMPYDQDISASGGTAPYVFSLGGGALPAGLALDGTGRIAGTPEGPGDFDFTVTATDATGNSGAQTYTLGVAAPLIALVPTAVPDGTVGVDYAVVFDASGGTAPYTFATTAGSLPPGLFLSSDGTLNGTPSVTGDYAFTVTATDNFNQTGAQDYAITVQAATISVSPATLPPAVVGTPYEAPLAADGGTGPYSFSIGSGTFPAGMGMDGDGIVDGTPEEAGTFAFTAIATDAFGQTGERAYTLLVVPPDIDVAPEALADARVGEDYAATFSASGGNGPYTFAVTSGSLPPGMFLDSDGPFHGAPTAAGDYAFSVTATDTYGQVGTRAYALHVGLATTPIEVLPTSLAHVDATVGVPFEFAFAASGGTAPYDFTVSAGALPRGLNLSPAGVLAGVAYEWGDNNGHEYAFTITATDATGQQGTGEYVLEVNSAVVLIGPPNIPAATVGEPYSTRRVASGSDSFQWAIVSGTPPPGIFISGDGLIQGTPQETGTFDFTVRATGPYGEYGDDAISLLVLPQRDWIFAPATLPPATVGFPFDVDIEVTGGDSVVGYWLSGDLPPGIEFDEGQGRFHGTATAPGEYPLTVHAEDGSARTGEHLYTLTVVAPEITLSPTTIPSGTVGVDYEVFFVASGGTAPHEFAVSEGELPPGMQLASDGTLAGTPTAEGSFGFTISATDAFDQVGDQAYVLAVSSPPLPDPTEDPDVVGLLTSQVSTVRTFATSQIANVHDRLESLHDGGGQGWGFWIAGSIRSGDRDGNHDASPMSFETSGMTGGSDYRLNNTFAFGGGLGFARDRTSVGSDGSRSDGEAPSGVSYMSWHPDDLPFFLDGMGGYQRLEFDVQRVTGGGVVYEGRRLGRQRFSSWSGGYEYENEAETFLFSPYARVDAADADLHGFREQGDDPLALQFGPQRVDLRTTTLGFRMRYRTEVEWGVLEPRLRIEFQRDFHDEAGVAIRYANQASSPVFMTTPVGLDRNRIVLELGTLLRTNWYQLLVRVDYLGVYGGYNDSEHTLRFSFQED